ncbi:MAG: phospholipase [Pirellulaceae bacterium]
MSDAPITVSHATLRSLHRIHRQLSELQDRVDRGPRQIAAGQTAVEALRTQLQSARETLKQAKIACDRKQLQLKEREQRVEDLGVKLNSAASNREFQSFKDQIAADKQANGVLADEILEALERIDSLGDDVQQKESELKQRESEQANLVQDIESKLAVLNDDLKRTECQLAEAESELSTSVRETYQRLVRGNSDEALAPVEGNSCGNCGSTFAPQVLNRLMLSHFVCCPSCAAILYISQD